MKLHRFKIISIFLIAILGGVLANFAGYSYDICVLFGWLLLGGVYLSTSFFTVFKVKSNQIIQRAGIEDLGVWLQFGLLLVACTTALVSIVFWRNGTAATLGKHQYVHLILFLVSVSFAWLVMHTSFLFRYAHLYYGDENDKFNKHTRGLEFPDDEQPDYFDFAYYSFTIGMTFQVSDVVVKSKGIRRLTLIHSLLSFLFNTVLVAITINEVLNL